MKTFILASFMVLTFNLCAQSAKDIMVEFDQKTKEASYSLIQNMKLSTFKYTVSQGKVRATEKPKISVLEIVSKDTGTENKDTRSVSIVKEPARDNGISMLTYAYDESGKDDDNWLYLSVLGKVKRLVSSNNSNDESGSFFGSEFSIEDVSARKIDDYTYKLIEETTYANRPVWMIELVPTSERTKTSKYGKINLWIDKERFVALKQDLYNRNGILFKRLIARNVEKVNNVWVARKAEMNNLFSRKATIMELTAIAYNIDVPDELLTQRVLTDFAFREKNLVELRGHLN